MAWQKVVEFCLKVVGYHFGASFLLSVPHERVGSADRRTPEGRGGKGKLNKKFSAKQAPLL